MGGQCPPGGRGFARENGALTAIRVVAFDGLSLEASTASADGGDKAAPRRLAREEKPLYDQGQRLRAAVETNRQEGAARKEEIEIAPSASGGLALAAPLEKDGAVVGLVAVETTPLPSPPRTSWLAPLAAALIPALAFLVLAVPIAERRWVLAAVAAALLLGTMVAYGRYAFATIAGGPAGHGAHGGGRGRGGGGSRVVGRERALARGSKDAPSGLLGRGPLPASARADRAGRDRSRGQARREPGGCRGADEAGLRSAHGARACGTCFRGFRRAPPGSAPRSASTARPTRTPSPRSSGCSCSSFCRSSTGSSSPSATCPSTLPRPPSVISSASSGWA